MKKILALIMFLALSLTVFAACNTSPAEKTAKKNAEAQLAGAADYLYQLYKDDEVTAVDYTVSPQVGYEGVLYPITWTVEVPEGQEGKVAVTQSTDAETGKPVITVEVDSMSEEDVEYVLVATLSLSVQVGEKTLEFSCEKRFPRTLPAFRYTTFDEYVAAANGANLFVKGYVSAIVSKSKGASYNCIYVEDYDREGGYYVYSLADTTYDPVEHLAIGDVVRVNGNKELYNGTHELKSASIEKLDEEAIDLQPIDITEAYASATALTDEALVGPQAQYVIIKGVTITGQDPSNGYYKFKLGELESYVRISSSTCPLSTADIATFKQTHTENYGMLADVAGVISIYSGAFYLTPVDVNAFSNIRMPDRTDAEKVAFELDSLDLGIGSEIGRDTTVALPATGVVYDTVAITWTLDGEAVSGSVDFAIGAADVAHTLVATATINGVSATRTINFTVLAKSEDLPAGVAFAMGVVQVTAGKTVYVTGEASGRYLSTTENVAEAAAVFAEVAEGGYKFYIVDAEGAKLYLDIYLNDEGKDSVRFAAEGENVFAYNGVVNAWITMHEGKEYYIGCYNSFTTLSASKASYINAENTGVSQFPSFFAVNETVAYNYGVVQVTAGKTVYVTGEASGRYLSTTENTAEAAKVYFEKATDGYKFYIVDAEGAKLYLDIYLNDEGKDSVRFAAEGENVFTYKAEVNAWITMHEGKEYYIGCYNSFTTLSASKASYINAENTGVSQFPSFFAVATTAGGGEEKPEEVVEPAVIENVTVTQLLAVESALEMKQAYTVTGTVSAWRNDNTDGTAYGNFYLSDGTNEILVYGATATATALVWNSTSGVYAYTNAKDFLTNDVTKTIAIGSTVTLKVVRTSYNGTAQLYAIVLSAEGGEEKPEEVVEPAVIENVTVTELLAVESALEMKQAYTVTGTVSGWKDANTDGTAYGNFRLSDGTNDILVYGATATATALVWNSTSGVYAYTNAKDFLTNDVTKAIAIGDTVTLKVVRTSYNGTAQLYAIVLSVEAGEEEHVCEFSTEWSKDDTHHWHACTCGEVADKAEHVYVNGVCECGAEQGVDPVLVILQTLYALEEGESTTESYTLTGVITGVDTAYSSQYGNVSVTIVCGEYTQYPVLCFRAKGTGADVITVGDTITVTGTFTNYNGKYEFNSGCSLDSYVKHTCVKGTEFAQDENQHWNTCVLCNAIMGEKVDHTYVEGECECGAQEPTGQFSITKVTNANQLVEGAQILLTYKTFAMGAHDGSKFASVSGFSESLEEPNASWCLVTLVKSGDNWLLKLDNGQYVYYTGSSNNIKVGSVTDTSAQWKITINSNGTASIVNVKTTARYFQYNTSSPRFVCYKASSNQQNPTLYIIEQ